MRRTLCPVNSNAKDVGTLGINDKMPYQENAQNVQAPTGIKKRKITQEKLKHLFDYKDGNLIRKFSKSNAKKGTIAGTAANKDKYVQISIDDTLYLAHVLIWCWFYGYIPEHDIDHIDRNKSNNKIENLREVSRVCNLRNTLNTARNTSGVKGVGWSKQNSKWRAQIHVNSRSVNLGYSTDFIEAVCLRLVAEQCLGYSECITDSPAAIVINQYLKGD